MLLIIAEFLASLDYGQYVSKPAGIKLPLMIFSLMPWL